MFLQEYNAITMWPIKRHLQAGQSNFHSALNGEDNHKKNIFRVVWLTLGPTM